MFNKWKKGVCLILALVLLLPAFPATAFANGELEPREAEVVNRDLSPMEQLQTGANKDTIEVNNVEKESTPEILKNSESEGIPTPEESGFSFETETDENNVTTAAIKNYNGKEANVRIPSKILINNEVLEVTKIKSDAFRMKTNVKEVFIPNSIKEVEKMGIGMAWNLEKIVFEDSENPDSENPIKIDTRAFQSDNRLNYVKLPEGLKTVPQDLFTGSFSGEGKKVLIIPSTVEKIEKRVIRKSGVTVEINLTEEEFKDVEVAEEAFAEGTKFEYLPPDSGEENVIEDKYLRMAINRYIAKDKTGGLFDDFTEERTDDQPVTKEDLGKLLYLDLEALTKEEKKKIKSIKGLEYCIQIKELNIQGTSVTDLSPLKDLQTLTDLSVGGTYEDGGMHDDDSTDFRSPLTNIEPISNLKHLSYLFIEDSEVVDISSLANLQSVDKIFLRRNKIVDVSPLKDLPNPKQIHLQGNCIADFSPLKNQKGLRSQTTGQTVTITPDSVEFDNPLKNKNNTIQKIVETDYIKMSGDYGEKIKVVKAPENDEVLLKTEYPGRSTLLIDISKIRDQLPTEEPAGEKHEVFFHVTGKQGDHFIGRLLNAKIIVTDKNNKPLENDGNVPYIWTLPKGQYNYEISYPDYETAKGKFTVEDADKKIGVPLQYKVEDNYPYPTISNIRLVERAHPEHVLGTGTISNGQIISIVVPKAEDRKLCYGGKAMLKADTENAYSYELHTEASPSDLTVHNNHRYIRSLNNVKIDSGQNFFKEDGLTFLELFGKGGKSSYYVIAIKENPEQHAVIFMAPSYTDGKLGSIKIHKGGNVGGPYYEVYRFFQLVEDGQKAKEPIQYIKDKYGKKAEMVHIGGVFEGWYHNADWEEKYDFDTPVTRDFELKAKFSNSGNINEFPDPYTIWFEGPGVSSNGQGNSDTKRMEEIVSMSFLKDGQYVKPEYLRDVQVKYPNDLQFKLSGDENWGLACIYGRYSFVDLPIRKVENDTFIVSPAPAQNNDMFEKNYVYFNFMPKDDINGEFDLSKQHLIDMEVTGPDIKVKYLEDAWGSTYGQAGNKIRFTVEGYKIENPRVVKNSNGESVDIQKVGKTIDKGKGIKLEEYSFIMPDEDVTIKADGYGIAPTRPQLAHFTVKDQNGNVLSPADVEKLVVSTAPYDDVVIEDIKEPVEIKTNATGRSYNYVLTIKDHGDFFGNFDWNGEGEIVLTVDLSGQSAKTRKDVESLIEVAERLLKDTDKYTSESLDNLENAINTAKHKMNLQNFDDAFYSLTAAINNLEEATDVPGGDDDKKPGSDDKKPGSDDKKPGGNNSGSIIVNDDTKKADKKETLAEKINKAHEKLVNETRYYNMKDIKGHWANDVIKYVLDHGYFIGTSKTTFSPNREATRAEFVTVLGRLAGINPKNYKANEFKDVPSDVYYEPFINWAVEKGIIQGVGNNKFEPNRPITREEMAVMLDKYLQVIDKEFAHGAGKIYEDRNFMSDWAISSIDSLTEQGILQGRENNQFAPKAHFTRAEVAQVIYNLETK